MTGADLLVWAAQTGAEFIGSCHLALGSYKQSRRLIMSQTQLEISLSVVV